MYNTKMAWILVAVMIACVALADVSRGKEARSHFPTDTPEKGEEVVALRAAPLQVQAKRVGSVSEGDTLVVEDIRGEWLWVRRGQTHGWIKKENVISAALKKGNDIAEWENFIRYFPRDPQAERTFRAIVRAASDPKHYDRNLEYADLVDIEKAHFNDQTGELILIGPRIRDWGHGYLPPLLVMDDFAMALRVFDAVGEQMLGVSIGTYNYGAAPGQQEEDHRLQRQNVEYIPQMIAGTHMGSVLFEADRWLKILSHGRDNRTLQPVRASIPGYRTQPERAYEHTRKTVLSGAAKTGMRPYGLNWFLPAPPQVQVEGYSMRFVSYRMTVEYKAMEPDPQIAAFAQHMTENFDAYCRQFVVFQELVRLHKLVQVAKWYRACGFPEDPVYEYKPLRIPTPHHTRRLTSLIGRFDTPRGYVESSLLGGVDFSPGNVYLPSFAIPAHARQAGMPPLATPFQVMAAPIAPTRYGSYDGPAPVPRFVAPIVQARPSPTACAWTVRINGRILKAIAIPMQGQGTLSNVPTRHTPAAALASAVPPRPGVADINIK